MDRIIYPGESRRLCLTKLLFFMNGSDISSPDKVSGQGDWTPKHLPIAPELSGDDRCGLSAS